MRYVIDRFEENFAVIENIDTLETENRPREEIPQGAKEGDALVLRDGAFVIDTEETRMREKRIKNLFSKLKKM